VLNHKLKDNIDIGVTWVYGTGNAVTLALEKYNELSNYKYLVGTPDGRDFSYYSSMISYFEKRNSYRVPAYHRLDVGINFHKETKWGKRTWSIGAYNVYNRKNPIFLNFESQYGGPTEAPVTVLKQYSLFPIIPSISYSFKIRKKERSTL